MAPRRKGKAVAGSAPVFEPLPESDSTTKTSVPVGHALLSPSEAVRWQAGLLREAIEAARAEGYVVDLPFRLADLDRIAVSATAKALAPK